MRTNTLRAAATYADYDTSSTRWIFLPLISGVTSIA